MARCPHHPWPCSGPLQPPSGVLSGLSGTLQQKSSQPVGAECRPPTAPLHPRLSVLSSAREQSLPPPPPGSPPPGTVLPRPRPQAGHDGKGQRGQEGEEAEVQQALEAVVADAGEGIQVVLEEEEGHAAAGGEGHCRGSQRVSGSPSPPASPPQSQAQCSPTKGPRSRPRHDRALLGFSLHAFTENTDCVCAGLGTGQMPSLRVGEPEGRGHLI